MHPLLDLTAHPIIAHRGASGERPENTLASFERAVELGADILEFDVRMTADGEVIVMHDPTLARTTDLSGPARILTLAELRAADAGFRFTPDRGTTFPYRGRGVRVPTLGEVLERFPAMPVLLELKEVAGQEKVRELVMRHGAEGRCVIASEHHDALEAFRGGGFRLAASGREIFRFWRASVTGKAPAPVDYHVLSVPRRHRLLPVVTRPFLANARRMGIPVHVWTINDPRMARRLCRKGVNGIITNWPERIRRGLRSED
jgi:glycerophosphoryl diester phosphodiesterase